MWRRRRLHRTPGLSAVVPVTHPLTTVDADDRVAVVASLPYYFGNSGGIAWCAGVVRDGGCAGHLAKVDSAELWWTMLPVSHFYASADLFPHTRPPGDSPATTTDDQPMQSRWFKGRLAPGPA